MLYFLLQGTSLPLTFALYAEIEQVKHFPQHAFTIEIEASPSKCLPYMQLRHRSCNQKKVDNPNWIVIVMTSLFNVH